MEQLSVRRYDTYKFSLTYKSIPDFSLRLNFEPLIREFNLEGDFTLLHWQAKPKTLRRWGAFCQQGETTQYHFFDNFIAEPIPCKGFQLNESETIYVPTAVIYYPNASCSVYQGKGRIQQIK